ncbi:TPA: late control D family protein [Escherichia coli]|nr:late control D family protein [Escherichia coli]
MNKENVITLDNPVKRVIDEQDWTITKVTHFLNNSGFTTSLELEVRLSDVEYETEDYE